MEHLEVMGKESVGHPKYGADMISRSFEYFAISRSLYDRLCSDYELACVRTLTRITSKVSSIDDIKFLRVVFGSLPVWQKRCILLWDEIYIKAALSYHGGSLFGRAVDIPNKLAKTSLCMMLKCLLVDLRLWSEHYQ